MMQIPMHCNQVVNPTESVIAYRNCNSSDIGINAWSAKSYHPIADHMGNTGVGGFSAYGDGILTEKDTSSMIKSEFVKKMLL